MTLPGAILGNVRWQAFDTDGEPLVGALLYSYTTGGTYSTPQPLYTNSGLTIAHANPVVADADGRFPAMYLSPIGYDLRLKTSAGVTVWSCLDVEDIGQTFLATLGAELATGSEDVASGYTVLASDNLITTDAGDTTNPFIVNLQPAADRTFPIGIKHQTANALRITPDGTETIEGLAAFYAVAAAASPNFPTVWLWPKADGSGYWIGASHGL